jgi:translation initiation factor IF-2
MKNKADVKKPKMKKKTKSKVSEVFIKEGMNLRETAEILGIKTKDLTDKLATKGLTLSVNDLISESIADHISKELGLRVKMISIEKEIQQRAESNPEEMIPRPPVVTIMGHVDHGKTTLLDAIRESNLVGKESGGITQHIGAYQVLHKNRPITLIDTPGHEAFTQLRARGAKLTDIVVLVVAADDGVMPQTREAINHAQAADVPIMVAINKTDKKEADIDKTKQQLSKEGLLVEDWGGDIISVDISAKEKTNLDELQEMILLLSDVIEIKTNPNVKAHGVILEARLDTQKGPVAAVIIQHGILSQGEAFVSGTCYGKIRALFNEKGKPLKKAVPSLPVEVLGFSEVPSAGDIFQVTSNLEQAKQIAQYRLSRLKKEQPIRPERLTLDELFKKIEEEEIKELPLLIKADVQGSVDTLMDILPSLSTEQVRIKIIHSATGNITESDVLLASASNAIILAYNIKPNQKTMDLANEEKVEIRPYTVIYHLTEDLKKALKGLLEPVIKETYLGRAEIRRIFKVPRAGTIAGCFVVDGKIIRKAEARVIREEEVIHQGRISSLKHLKDNVAEVTKDSECGIGLEKFSDIKEGDIIEVFISEKIKPE